MLFGRPRFDVVEEWDESGDVSVYFRDKVSSDLQDRVGRELSFIVPKLEPYQKTVYHVENIVNRIFANMHCKGNLRLTCDRNQWVWAEEV